MKKRTLFHVCMLVIVSFLLLPSALSFAGTQRVYDNAGLLTSGQKEDLEAACEKNGKKAGAQIVIVTSDDPDVFDIEDLMKDLHDEKSLGDTVMLGVDMRSRRVTVSAFGAPADSWMSHDRVTLIREKITPYLTKGRYDTGFSSFVSLTAKYKRIKPGVNPDNLFLKTWFQLIIALAAGAVTAGIMAFNRKPKMTAGSSTYLDHDNARILARHDRYIRTTVTKQPRPKNNDNDNGGGSSSSSGGGGGGSSYTSSSGSF